MNIVPMKIVGRLVHCNGVRVPGGFPYVRGDIVFTDLDDGPDGYGDYRVFMGAC